MSKTFYNKDRLEAFRERGARMSGTADNRRKRLG